MGKNILSFFILVTLVSVLAIIYVQLPGATFQTTSTKLMIPEMVEKETESPFPKETRKMYELIGKDREEVIKLLGQPRRIDASEYDYDWWIYNESITNYCQIGIENDKVVTVYVMGENNEIAPFHIGQTRNTLETIVDLSDKVALEVDKNLYQFELTKEEVDTVPLIQYKNIWAQIYIDKFSGTISSIRFLDAETLVKIRPYELVYRGNLISAKEIASKRWYEIEKGKALQILDMTNVLRERNGLSAVNWDESAAVVAYDHSREMFEEKYFSHNSPTYGDLADRLVNGGVDFRVAGENIAARYVDAISAVEGWLNSEGHRTTLLNKEFTHLGVGVYEKYYTQNFIKAW
ncbi:MAG TPA: CAP domain-containing protein [Bacillales bacterium]|nr:CAP domain-containing protein [Bacillales bacterium]